MNGSTVPTSAADREPNALREQNAHGSGTRAAPVSAAGDRLQGTARRAALALPDVSHGRPLAPGLDLYKVAGKVLLIVTDDQDVQIITVTCEPEHARAQERGYATLTPGRCLDKRHWIPLGPRPGITKRLVTDAVEHPYGLDVTGLWRHTRPGAR